MDEIDKKFKEHIVAVRRALRLNKYINGNDDIPATIEEGLYLGSLGASRNKSALKGFNVTHVLIVANSIDPPHPNDFTYKIIKVSDREDVKISLYFNECFNFIDDARKKGGSVLVHCLVGKSRSATMVIAYLMKKHNMSLSEAFKQVKNARPIVSPNSGFMLQLQNFEKSLQRSQQTEIELNFGEEV